MKMHKIKFQKNELKAFFMGKGDTHRFNKRPLGVKSQADFLKLDKRDELFDGRQIKP